MISWKAAYRWYIALWWPVSLGETKDAGSTDEPKENNKLHIQYSEDVTCT